MPALTVFRRAPNAAAAWLAVLASHGAAFSVQASPLWLAATSAEGDKLRHLRKLLASEPLASFGVHISIGEALSVVVTILLTVLVSRLLQAGLHRYGKHHADVNQAALYTISRLMHYVLMVAGVLLALHMAGIPLSQFAVFTGAIGVGLGFGLQQVFSNFISGVILLFDRSLKVGDFVELDDDVRGVVRAINIRSTLITTNDNIDVLVPNSEFVTKRLVNWTHGSVNRRVRITFTAGYDVDKELVKKAALEAAAAVPFTLATEGRHRPQVWLTGFGESEVEYILAVWLTEDAARRNTSIRAAYLWELDTALKAHGIGNSYPQRDLNIRSLFGLQGAEALGALQNAGHLAPGTLLKQAPEQLAPLERALLARNDAKDETSREIAEDAAAPEASAAPPADTPSGPR